MVRDPSPENAAATVGEEVNRNRQGKRYLADPQRIGHRADLHGGHQAADPRHQHDCVEYIELRSLQDLEGGELFRMAAQLEPALSLLSQDLRVVRSGIDEELGGAKNQEPLCHACVEECRAIVLRANNVSDKDIEYSGPGAKSRGNEA